MRGALFAAVFVALYAAHQVGDHWLQTGAQAADKGLPGWRGRLADARHVATLIACKAVALTAAWWTLSLPLHAWIVALALLVDGASHYWADRRFTLRWLAGATGHSAFYRLGAPREGRDDNPSLGTGAYALDQSWHVMWLMIAALIAAH